MEQNGKWENCLDLIKLIAATQVFIGHVVSSFNVQIDSMTSFIISIFEGVPIFFCLSGFLIWGSIGRSKSFSIFVKKRVLRLYPELWGGVLLNAIILVLLYHNSIHWPEFVLFQITQSTIFQFWTPDFLRGYATGIPNSPLWTIGVMVQCYIALWFCYRFLHNKGRRRWALTIAVFVLFNLGRPLIEPYVPHILYRLIWNAFPTHLWMFLLGGIVWEYFDSLIPILKKGWIISLILAIVVNYYKIDVGNYPLLKSAFLLCFSIGFAYSFPTLKLKHDFSYGLYLYHMIVINVMVFFGTPNSILYIILAYIISLLLSVASYFTSDAIRYRKKICLKY